MFHPHKSALAAAALVLLASLPGCVERKITIGSDPAGTILVLNDQEVGRTPLSVPYEWNGDYDVKLRYEKNLGTPEKPDIHRYYLHTDHKTKVPWFDIIGIDLIAELLPVKFKDEQVWGFSIPEVKSPPDAELVKHAEELKARLGEPEDLKNHK